MIGLEKYTNTKIVETDDFLDCLFNECGNKAVLLITSPSFVKRGLIQKLTSLFSAKSLFVASHVSPNPEVEEIREIVNSFGRKRIDAIVGIGGGSVIDTAKICSTWLSAASLSFEQLMSNNRDLLCQRIPVIAIPSTAGTGAEVTPFATVWDKSLKKKHSISGISPALAVLDPNLTISLNHQNTIYPALDALSHALESLWNVNSCSESSSFAQQAIDSICSSLPTVLVSPESLIARKELQKAATMAGLAISKTKTAIAHAISYPLTLHYGIPHGLACSFTLTAIIEEFGSQQLNLTDEIVLKIKKLIRQLNLQSELAQFATNEQILLQASSDLDPARTVNFIAPIGKETAIRIVERSLGISGG